MANYFHAVIVAGVNTLVFAANPDRKGLMISTQANGPIWIRFDGTAAVVNSSYFAISFTPFVYVGPLCPTGEIRVTTSVNQAASCTELDSTDVRPA